MTTAIAGSKSSKYIKDPISGIDNSVDTLTYQSVQNLWDARGASDVLIHALYATTAVPFLIEVGSVKRLIKVTGHGAAIGDFIRMNDGLSESEEVAIIKIIDADFFVIAKEVNASIGDELFIMKNVTPTYNKDGSLNVSNGPIQFIKDAVVQQVIQDTVVPANTVGLPSSLYIDIDGVTYPVGKDTGTPANTVSIPVEITGATGPINITAGDLNVQLSDLGANFDRTRIGNGTNQWDMNASSEGLVHDQDVLDELVTLNTVDFSTAAKQDLLLAELQLKADLTETQPVSVASLPLPTGAATSALQTTSNTKLDTIISQTLVTKSGGVIDANTLRVTLATDGPGVANLSAIATSTASVDTKTPVLGQALAAASVPVVLTAAQISTITPPAAITGFALETTQTANNVLVGAVTETAPASDTASSGLNGRLQRIAQRLTALIAQIPASLGIKTAANSLSIAPASDAIFNVKPKALTGSFAENLTLTTVATFTAPANAIGAKIMADDTNTANVRYKQGAAATVSSGMQLQAGRSEDIGNGSDVSIISESGTQKVMIIWNIQA